MLVITRWYPWIAWWIFPVRYVNVYQAGYTTLGGVPSDGREEKIEVNGGFRTVCKKRLRVYRKIKSDMWGYRKYIYMYTYIYIIHRDRDMLFVQEWWWLWFCQTIAAREVVSFCVKVHHGRVAWRGSVPASACFRLLNCFIWASKNYHMFLA
jgi:hypothetical protein